jgi:hypothetical protein
MGFSHEENARRVMDVLPKRFEKYGLTVDPEKTRLVSFERPGRGRSGADSGARTPPGTFELLNFVHYWARSRKGNWVVERKTSKSHFRRELKALSEWCRSNRHRPVEAQHQTLSQKLVGHFAYYGITGNTLALVRFRDAATWIFKRRLSRRRRRANWISRDRLNHLLKRYPLPPARAPLGVPSRSARVTRRARCLNRTHLDLWEPWGSNPPRRAGPISL